MGHRAEPPTHKRIFYSLITTLFNTFSSTVSCTAHLSSSGTNCSIAVFFTGYLLSNVIYGIHPSAVFIFVNRGLCLNCQLQFDLVVYFIMQINIKLCRKERKLCDLTLLHFLFRMVLKYVRSVAKPIVIVRRNQINSLMLNRRTLTTMLLVHGQMQRHYSF
jgi:hypothetical protein